VIFGTIVLTLVVFSLLSLSNNSITGNAVFTPTIPADCSDESIRATWDSIFEENSLGTTVIINSTESEKCNSYYAHKVVGDFIYLLSGKDIGGNVAIQAFRANSTQAYKDQMTSITEISSEEITQIIGDLDIDLDLQNRSITITEVYDVFDSVFKITPTLWGEASESSFLVYLFDENSNDGSELKYHAGVGMANYSADWYLFSLSPIVSCTANWTAQNNSCQSDDRITTYYVDDNSCGSEVGKPSNETEYCDYGNDSVIGNFSDLDTSRVTLAVYINGTSGNSSKDYSDFGETKVELKSGNDVVVEFDWDFSSVLNLDKIYVQKQLSSADLGYLLVRGIKVDKTILVNKLNSSSDKICIKDEEIDSIGEVSVDCSGSNEELISCPHTGLKILCSLENNGTHFKVSGLDNSAVIEYMDGCALNWNCTSWSPCSNGQQTRTCEDINSCGTNLGKPNLTKSCSAYCTPDWNCTSWQPEECSENGTQTRVCTDINSCGTDDGKSPESKTCKEGSGSGLWRWIIIILAIIFGVIIIALIILWLIISKRKSGSAEGQVQESPPQSPPPSDPQIPQQEQQVQQVQPFQQAQVQPAPQPQPTQPMGYSGNLS